MILLFERKEVDVKMLTYEQAKKIGQEACIDRLGRDFVMKYRDTSCPAFSESASAQRSQGLSDGLCRPLSSARKAPLPQIPPG